MNYGMSSHLIHQTKDELLIHSRGQNSAARLYVTQLSKNLGNTVVTTGFQWSLECVSLLGGGLGNGVVGCRLWQSLVTNPPLSLSECIFPEILPNIWSTSVLWAVLTRKNKCLTSALLSFTHPRHTHHQSYP